MIRLLATVWLLTASQTLSYATSTSFSAPTPAALSALAQPGHPVLLGGDTLFWVRATSGDFSARERAVVVSQRLEAIAASIAAEENARVFVPESLKVERPDGDSGLRTIRYGDQLIVRIHRSDLDVAPHPDSSGLERASLDSLASAWRTLIREHLDGTKADAEFWRLAARTGGVAAILLLILIVEVLVFRLARRAKAAITRAADEARLPGFKIQGVDLLTPRRARDIAEWTFKGVITAAHLAVAFGALLMLFALFPWTRTWASILFAWTLRPLTAAFQGFVNFLPDLFHIVVVVALAHLFLRLLRRLTAEVESGNLTIPGFYSDWARPTLNIVRFVTYAFALVLIFPHLPGSDSVAFKGVSVFLGILISLGSSSAFSNIVAGIVMTYMRSFRLGDRIEVGTVIGDVVEKTLLVTRIKTFHGETVTLPNSALLAGNTVNYTVAAAGPGLLLHTQVTIGYDAPWRRVHELLIDAARKTGGVVAEPPPFVLQKALNDFYVCYEVNLYTREPERMNFIYSELHQNIQDCFFAAGVEIMSPHYRANRDGNAVAIPPHPHGQGDVVA